MKFVFFYWILYYLFFRYSKHEIFKRILPTNRYIIHFYFIAIAIGWFDCNVNFLLCVRAKLLGSYSKYNRSIWIFFCSINLTKQNIKHRIQNVNSNFCHRKCYKFSSILCSWCDLRCACLYFQYFIFILLVIRWN